MCNVNDNTFDLDKLWNEIWKQYTKGQNQNNFEQHSFAKNKQQSDSANIYAKILDNFILSLSNEQEIIIQFINQLNKIEKEYKKYLPLILQTNLSKVIEIASMYYLMNNQKMLTLIQIIEKTLNTKK